ncbi:MAG: hypothetical protein WCX69_00830 [Candidatus Paceibacterota bacterium]
MSLNKKSFFAAIVFAALFLGVMFFVCAPVISNIKNVGIEILRQRQKIVDYDRRISKTREFGAFARREKSALGKLGGVFVDSQMPLDFINSLEAAARDTEVEIKLSSSLSQSGLASAAGWPSISIEGEITGQIPGILRFVKKIENSPYLVEIKSFDIEAIESAAKSANEDQLADWSDSGKAHILMEAYAKSQ